jgi:hypothetical protein
MDRAFWIGVYPGLTPEMISYMIDVIATAPEKCSAMKLL